MPPSDDAPRLDPDDIAARSFGTRRKGYDASEVRTFLEWVADSQRHLLVRVQRAEETEARAAEIVSNAEVRAAELIREAQDEARRIVEAVAGEREKAFAEGAGRAEALLADAEARRAGIEEQGTIEAQRMVAEARAARTRVLDDLRRRRRVARAQVEQLNAARERLLVALAEVRNAIETTTAGLRDVMPEVKGAADAAARRVMAEDDATIEQLEAEIELLKLAGLSLLPGQQDTGEQPVTPPPAEVFDVEAVDAEIEPEVEPDVEPEAAPDAVVDVQDEPPPPPEPVDVEVEPDADAEPYVPPERPVPQWPSAIEPPPAALHREGDDDHGVSVMRPSKRAPEAGDEPVDAGAEAPGEAPDEGSVEAPTEEPVEDVVEEEEPTVERDEPGADDEPRDGEGRPSSAAVDALFARLKAGRSPEEPKADEPAPEAATSEPEPAPEPGPEPEPEPGPGDAMADLLGRRTAAVAPATSSLNRHLKRLLADQQNELLDRLRRTGTADVVPDADADDAAWAEAARADVALAAAAGSAFAGRSEPPVEPDADAIAEVAAGLADLLARPLREKVAQVVDESDGDAEVAADAVRAAFRTWRSERIGPAVDNAVTDAFNLGVVTAHRAGAPLQWVVDDDGPCSDCDDNALAGAIPSGEAFPTGHRRPPAHPGCRCVLVSPDQLA